MEFFFRCDVVVLPLSLFLRGLGIDFKLRIYIYILKKGKSGSLPVEF